MPQNIPWHWVWYITLWIFTILTLQWPNLFESGERSSKFFKTHFWHGDFWQLEPKIMNCSHLECNSMHGNLPQHYTHCIATWKHLHRNSRVCCTILLLWTYVNFTPKWSTSPVGHGCFLETWKQRTASHCGFFSSIQGNPSLVAVTDWTVCRLIFLLPPF